MSATIYATAKGATGPESSRRFARASFVVASNAHESGHVVEGYRLLYKRSARTYGEGTPTQPPWGIHRDTRPGAKGWTVTHIPTGLAVRSGIESLDAAKSLVLAFESSTSVSAWNLPQLAALRFNPTREDMARAEVRAETQALWGALRTWVEARAVSS